MNSNTQKAIHCYFCTSLNQQTKIMLIQLRKQLYKIKIDIEDQNWNQPAQKKSKPHLQAFCRLFHLIVGYKGEVRCRHDKIYLKYFRKIKGSHKLIAKFFQAKIQSLGFRNYQLDLLANQFDQISRRIAMNFYRNHNSDQRLFKTTKKQILDNTGKNMNNQQKIQKNDKMQATIKIQQQIQHIPIRSEVKIESPSTSKPLVTNDPHGIYYFPLYYPQPNNGVYFTSHNSQELPPGN